MVKWIDCGILRRAILKEVKKDYQEMISRYGKLREPTLDILLFPENCTSKDFVMQKAETLVKAGVIAKISLLPKERDMGKTQ